MVAGVRLGSRPACGMDKDATHEEQERCNVVSFEGSFRQMIMNIFMDKLHPRRYAPSHYCFHVTSFMDHFQRPQYAVSYIPWIFNLS